MFTKLISAVILTALAGRALAAAPIVKDLFNVTIGPDGKHSTLLVPQDVLNFDFGSFPLFANCNANCSQAKAAISVCTANSTACYCNANVTVPLQNCESCMFTNLIVANKPAPVALAGSNQVLTGWNTACASGNITLAPALGLAVPLDSWDGPFVSVFPTAIGWVIAVTGGVLGSSLIYMLCNM